MLLGTAQLDITPQPGVELSGFAARLQPSLGRLDPLFARAFFLVEGDQKLLWLHCDLVGFDREIVEAFRQWAHQSLGLAPEQVLLSATHTHSGPCTIRLQEAGTYDPVYVESLQACLRQAAKAAMASTEPVSLVAVEGQLELSVDRRKAGSAHTDSRVLALGFRRLDATYAGVLLNYPIHPVALGPTNRQISADIFGQTALTLSTRLPGRPVALVTNGACANLNPPAENVSFAQVQTWGRQIAEAVLPLLQNGAPESPARLQVATRRLALPLDVLDAAGIDAFAQKALQHGPSLAEWGDKYRRVVAHWRATLQEELQAGRRHTEAPAELVAVALGENILMGANAEVFSEFTDWLRRHTGQRLWVIGYVNGDMGYLPTRAAFAEGGYEVEVAHLFYGGFRPQPGCLEMLADEAARLVKLL